MVGCSAVGCSVVGGSAVGGSLFSLQPVRPNETAAAINNNTNNFFILLIFTESPFVVMANNFDNIEFAIQFSISLPGYITELHFR